MAKITNSADLDVFFLPEFQTVSYGSSIVFKWQEVKTGPYGPEYETKTLTLIGKFTEKSGIYSGVISKIEKVERSSIPGADYGYTVRDYLHIKDGPQIDDLAAFQKSGIIGVQLLLSGSDDLTAVFKGYGGDDVFHLSSIGEVDGGSGVDTVLFDQVSAGVDLRLYQTPDAFISIEKFVGSRFDDQMRGSSGNDHFTSSMGNDLLIGREGNDTLIGGSGNDRFIGGLGRDIMSGGSGGDVFVFESVLESPTGVRDIITDFNRKDDLIDLRIIDANSEKSGNQAFTFVGTGAFSGTAGELRFSYSSANKNTYVWGDIDGDKKSDFEFIVTGNVKLTSLDFYL